MDNSYAEQLEPGIYGNSDPGNVNAIVNGLASGMSVGQLGALTPSLAKGAYGVLKGLGNAGEVGLGALPDAVAGAKAITQGLQDTEGVTVYIKGVQKGLNGVQEPIYGVKGPANKLEALFGDKAPGSVPKYLLEKLGLISKPIVESQNPIAPFAQDLRDLWARAALEQSETPITLRAPYIRPDVVRP